MQTPRNATVDIAKGICIVLVVLGHNPLLSRELNWVLSSFRMPLFFLLAGLFLRPARGTGTFVVSRFHLILKPYLVVCAGMIVAKLLGAFNDIEVDAAQRLALGTLYGTGNTVLWTPLWFLPHLFAASCTTFLLLKAVSHRPPAVVLITAALLLAGGVHMIGRVGEWPWSIDLLPITVALMLTGWRWRETIASARFRWAPFTAALLTFLVLHALSDARLELNGRLWDSLLVCTAQAALGTYLVIVAASVLPSTSFAARAFHYAGLGSLFILIFHLPVHARVMSGLRTLDVEGTLAHSIALAASVLLPLFMWELARRTPPLAWLLLQPAKEASAPPPALPSQTWEYGPPSRNGSPPFRNP